MEISDFKMERTPDSVKNYLRMKLAPGFRLIYNFLSGPMPEIFSPFIMPANAFL